MTTDPQAIKDFKAFCEVSNCLFQSFNKTKNVIEISIYPVLTSTNLMKILSENNKTTISMNFTTHPADSAKRIRFNTM